MMQCVDVSNLQVFQSQLRTPEMTQTSEHSSKRSVGTKLEAPGIEGAPPQHYKIEEERRMKRIF